MGKQTPEAARRSNKASRQKVRLAAISHYSNGTNECACCQEIRIEFLVLDHTNGGGNEHRKATGLRGGGMYWWLRKNNYPEGFRVLCENCNGSYGRYGYCPHQEKQ